MSANNNDDNLDKSLINNEDLFSFRKMDLPLLIIFLLLCTFGLVMMFSSSISISFAQSGDNATAMIRKQFFITGGAVVLSLFIARAVNLKFFRKAWFRHLLYLVVTALLVLVLLRGQTFNGAKRWLNLKVFTFQPSEAAKIGAILWLSLELEHKKKYLRQKKDKWRNPWQKFWQHGRHLLTLPACKMLLWFALIVVQPHLSAAIIFALVVFVMFLFAGIKRSAWVAGIVQLLVVALVFSLLLLTVLPSLTGMSNSEFLAKRFAHVFKRMDTYQNPDQASTDAIRQIKQAQIALGSGGVDGVGLGRSVQKMNWLPEAHNDYILAIIGEELGFIGTTAVLLLFIAFMIRGFRIALKAKSNAGLMIAAGYTFFLVLQALINFGVATNLLPATGISLPFFSSGGTANAFFALATGMILLISKWDQREDPELIRILAHNRGKKLGPVMKTSSTNEETGTVNG
ncbi:MAG TPA: FtsW/RodA/SpoVE family cell cycle protein [Clostridiaceae bacterium]|nr:FtsW/RodA/SpoVE family cell cycle protein [Clostridiaceae bacterium]